MSARKLRLIFTEDARTDIRGILAYSEQRWGRQQRDDYRRSLRQAIENIRTYPAIGRERDDLASGVRGLVVRHHLILYRVESGTIRVLRVIHERMDTEGLDLP
jgi:toxin ParE1/3/4